MIRTGLDRLVAGEVPALRGRRVGLIANPTAVDAELRHAVDLLADSTGVRLTTLFGPEHGLRGDAQDMIGVDMSRDPHTNLPAWSLYGHDEASLSPTAAMLDGLDVLVYDVQDVGSRYYTFVWTMVLAMRAAAKAGIAFAVLDRPNPIGGALVEGGAIAPGYESFVGLVSCPNRHGLTAGEIARWRADVEKLSLELHVVEMQGWRREMYYEDTGLPWVLPSPNMPTRDTALVYPGMCLVEGTEASEGRGTTRPFELAGAPGVDGWKLAEARAAAQLPGVRMRPCTFTPTFQKHARLACGGVQLHVTDREAFRPYLTGVAFLHAMRAVGGDALAWRTRAYEFVDKIPAIDLLCGSPEIREGIDAGASLPDLAATWRQGEADWAEARRAWTIYG
jgi:uncharacterized protein YbbC (DUF1343 family)